MSRAARCIGYVATPLLALLVSLGAAEVYWRNYTATGNPAPVWNPDIMYAEAPSSEWVYSTPEFQTHIRTNSRGFRGPEFPTTKEPGITRIVFLGDSMVAAKQVEEGERFVDLVGPLLGEKVETVGLGIDGGDPIEELLYFRAIGKNLQPDLVVHELYLLNDVLEPRDEYFRLGQSGGELVVTDVTIFPASQPERSFFESKFLKALLTFIRRRFARVTSEEPKQVIGSFIRLTKPGLQELDAQSAWPTTMAILRTIRQEVQAAGADYLVLLIPSALEVQEQWQEEVFHANRFVMPRDQWDLEGMNDRMKAELTTEGIPFIDVRDAYRERVRTGEILYFKKDPHINVMGHRITAETIVENFRNFGI